MPYSASPALRADNRGIPSPHPGTPDADVSPPQLEGRLAFRRGERFMHSFELPVPAADRVQFWDGYYDDQLGYLFGRGVKG
jgi:hypothetical protein